VRPCVYGVDVWVSVYERERVLSRVEAYLSSIPRAGAILSASCLAPSYFSTLFHKRHDFRGTKSLNTKYVSFSLQILFERFLMLSRNHRDTVIIVKTSSCKVTVIFVGL
jgi:hypothetical protein